MTPPLRFLLLVIGGWAVLRVALLAFGSQPTPEPVPVAPAPVSRRAPSPAVAGDHGPIPFFASAPAKAHGASVRVASLILPRTPFRMVSAAPRPIPVAKAGDALDDPGTPASSNPLLAAADAERARVPDSPNPLPPGPVRSRDRLSAGAWLLVRGGREEVLASGNGLLGGSQAGARVLYRVSDDPATPVSLSARLSAPLRRRGAEAAVGVEWQPVAAIPVRLLAERRQRVSGEGRSAFAMLAHGGVSDRSLAAGFRLDAYGQAGVVGARRRDLFADAAVTLVRPLNGRDADGPAVGAGAWGGAQPGAARLDLGPRATTVLRVGDARARVSLDWRFRVAGGAAPASGPSLTIGADF